MGFIIANTLVMAIQYYAQGDTSVGRGCPAHGRARSRAHTEAVDPPALPPPPHARTHTRTATPQELAPVQLRRGRAKLTLEPTTPGAVTSHTSHLTPRTSHASSYHHSLRYGLVLEITNYLFALVFLAEAVIKLVALRLRYFEDNWNR